MILKIESLDDPRDQAIPNFPHQPAQGRNQSFSDAPFGGSGSGDNPLLDIISLLAGPGSFPPARSATSPNTRPMGSGVRIELSSGNNGRSRRVVFGGPPTMGFPAPPGSGADHSMHEYVVLIRTTNLHSRSSHCQLLWLERPPWRYIWQRAASRFNSSS